jgi:hypothetical protein
MDGESTPMCTTPEGVTSRAAERMSRLAASPWAQKQYRSALALDPTCSEKGKRKTAARLITEHDKRWCQRAPATHWRDAEVTLFIQRIDYNIQNGIIRDTGDTAL